MVMIKKQGDSSISESPKVEGEVGIFWVIDENILGNSVLSINAEDYGDFKIYPLDHYTTWEKLRQKDSDISLFAYDYFPRGRIAYNIKEDVYIIYIDKCLDSAKIKNEFIKYFHIPAINVCIWWITYSQLNFICMAY